MPRFSGATPPARGLGLLALLLASSVQAGPLPSNVTITEGGLNSESSSCALGDVVYMSGDEFPGAEPCERCACARGRVACARQECAPRPGCKAVHRPDHCCPTYQCECEQEGRVYGNGEKLVDPQDPCRVCYCQGGEVVCRRIACFVRDDCRPRLVPGRCCPEYDNCPLRGVSTGASMTPSNMAIEDVGTTAVPPPPPPVKQEITIKEITPVSEIPVITDVKIKEILPSPSIEVVEYPSSKAPLIPREATSEKSVSSEEILTPTAAPPTVTPQVPSSTNNAVETKITDELYPSKISFSTMDAINSDIYPSNVPSVSSTVYSSSNPGSSTKTTVIEEEDTSVFEHNPAFPPLPDDLSVLSNHEDEMAVEMDDHNEHVTVTHEVVTTVKAVPTETPTTAAPSTEPPSISSTTPAPTTTAAPATTPAPSTMPASTTTPAPTTLPASTTTPAPTTTSEVPTSREEPSSPPTENTADTETLPTKVSPMLNLRSALPTEILTVPSSVHEVITGDVDEDEPSTDSTIELTTAETTTTTIPVTTTTTPPPPPKKEERTTLTTKSPLVEQTVPSSPGTTTPEVTELKAVTSGSSASPSETTSYIPKSDIATEVTSLTELSSLPVETSDQHPPAPADSDRPLSTSTPLTAPTSIKMTPTESEAITVSRASSETQPFDNVETTEFILSSLGSSESTTDAVELIKISSDTDKSATVIDSSRKKGNVFTDLINLVGDVATIGDSTEEPRGPAASTGPVSIADSEELIPVNAGYKSKNNNFNMNSITESPLKSKVSASKPQVELESEDDAGITDGGRAEPTTQRAIIDRVDDAATSAAAPSADIEIITRSYVPTLSRRPTKVVQGEPAASAELSTDEPAAEEPAPAR